LARSILLAGALVLVSACGSPPGDAQARGPQAASSVETRAPNARGQTSAFLGQTRAPRASAGVAFETLTVAEGLDDPWGMAFLPDGGLLVSERPGRLRVVSVDGELSAPVAGLPAVDARGQGGLLGLALDPGFAQNGLVYFSFAERRAGDLTNTTVARGRLVADTKGNRRLEDVRVIFRQQPSMDSTAHYGGRLVFARDGTLFATLGNILPLAWAVLILLLARVAIRRRGR